MKPVAARRNTVDRGVQFPEFEDVVEPPRVSKVDVGVQTPDPSGESDGAPEANTSSDEPSPTKVTFPRSSLKGKERERTLSWISFKDDLIPPPAAPVGPKPQQSKKERLEARLKGLGAEEVCVGSPLEVLQRFEKEGRSFDAILDTVGGVAIWEAARHVLLADPFATDSTVKEQDAKRKRASTVAQFTTIVGDASGRAVPTSHDNFNSGLRSFRRTKSTMHHLTVNGSKPRRKAHKRTVNYSWVSPAADVGYEGEDVSTALSTVVRMAEDGTLKPTLSEEPELIDEENKIVPFERAPEVFRRDLNGPRGPLKDGGACVIKIVG